MIKKHIKPTYNNIVFDSEDEVEMMKWCEEAKKYGFIKDYSYHPDPFLLSDSVYEYVHNTKVLKTKTVEETKRRTLLQPCTYKPDFVLVEPIPVICNLFKGVDNEKEILIDVKGSFCAQTAKVQVFSIVRKWVYQKYSKFVNKVVVKDFLGKRLFPQQRVLGNREKYFQNLRIVLQ